MNSQKTDNLRFLISLSPSVDKIDRQNFCIQSWKQMGAKVFAIQSESEINELTKYYSNIEFVLGIRLTKESKEVYFHP